MIQLNKKEYLDKLHACWIGKNIGGTLGAPFEGKRDLINIDGFTTPEGKPLPNDDLDLQPVWLTALEEFGVKNFSTNILPSTGSIELPLIGMNTVSLKAI
ncbi:MAG: hypothetical protein E7616_09105 [Ruminococcaceae bacterium]|nr:hypothetical protein [Oscillospiraceae bacterium]